jgi:biotin/methionine sulfoxide reductase
VENTELRVCFGGLPLKNTAVSHGGVSQHQARDHLQAAAQRGMELVLLSPVRDDLPGFVDAPWHPLGPGTDVAVMLALAHTLIAEGLHDRTFLERYCVGFERFARYVQGQDDGQPKSPEWAEQLSEVPAEAIRALARRMASHRTLINVTWSLQRADHGEQVPWMAVTLASMLGQIGLPGAGFAHGYSSTAQIGATPLPVGLPSLPQGKNPVRSFIPVARISDLLLRPGEDFDYDGRRLTYPDIRLVYWCGGNPFHHHQDLGRLRRALARPDTIVVHDAFWTGMARHADIVLPATVTLERNDIGGSGNDGCLVAMHQAVEPYGMAGNDYDIFAALAAELGVGDGFTEGRSEMAWLHHLYEGWRASAGERGFSFPDFAEFWNIGYLPLRQTLPPPFGRTWPGTSPRAVQSRLKHSSKASDHCGPCLSGYRALHGTGCPTNSRKSAKGEPQWNPARTPTRLPCSLRQSETDGGPESASRWSEPASIACWPTRAAPA